MAVRPEQFWWAVSSLCVRWFWILHRTFIWIYFWTWSSHLPLDLLLQCDTSWKTSDFVVVRLRSRQQVTVYLSVLYTHTHTFCSLTARLFLICCFFSHSPPPQLPASILSLQQLQSSPVDIYRRLWARFGHSWEPRRMINSWLLAHWLMTLRHL